MRSSVQRLRGSWTLAGALILASCGDDGSPPTPPEIDNDEIALARAVDENDDPTVFELTLEARTAEVQYGDAPSTPVWAYNGTVP